MLGPRPASILMPGGGLSRRPLHLVIIADCSGSMKGEKIQALNYAIADMLPHLAEWERDQEQAQVLIRALSFATEPQWHVPEPVPVGQLHWQPLRVVEKGLTNMGPAFETVARSLRSGQLESRALRPALLLITDGLPTDPPGRFESGLGTLLSVPAGRSALRLALAIGRDASSEALNRFINDPAVPVLVADSTEDIAERLVVASIALSRMSEVGADRDSLAGQLLQRQTAESVDLLDRDTIV